MNNNLETRLQPKTKVRNVMRQVVEVVHVDHTLSEAAVRMSIADVGWLLVVDADEVVGVVTDRDIVARCVANGREPAEAAIDEAMSAPIVSCGSNESLANAAEIMRVKRVRRLVVADDTNRCIGVISIEDLIHSDVDRRVTSAVLRSLSIPSHDSRKVGEALVGHGRATGAKIGAPQNYSTTPKIKSERAEDGRMSG